MDIIIYNSDYGDLYRIKLEMIALGWKVKETINTAGFGNNCGYNISFSRNEWHGKNTYSITGDDVVFAGHYKDASDITHVVAMARKISEMAKKAYVNFPLSIPMQTGRGTVVEAIMYVPFERGKDIVEKG